MSDALERLKNRNRPTVPQRDASLTPAPGLPPTPAPRLDTAISPSPEASATASASPAPPETGRSPRKRTRSSAAQNSPQSDVPKTEVSGVPEVEIPGYLDVPVSRYLDTLTSSEPQAGGPFVTKQSTVRFEQGMSDRLQALTRQQGLCREVLLEAMFDYCEANPQVMQAVLAASRSKQDQRQQAANLKRAQSMMQRFQ